MKKRKKRQAKKTVLRPHELTHLHWGWLLMGLTVLIACVVVAAFASSRSQTSSGNATIRPVGTSVTAPPGMGRQASQHTAGIFPLSAGGPIPVPANVLHPTNIARVLVKNVLTSIYAGSMTREPATGALAILQENLMTGQQSLHLYQTSQPVGSLTILAVQNDILTFSFAKAKGTFNLATDQFHF